MFLFVPSFVDVLVFCVIILLGFVFVFRMFLVVLYTHFIPHTHVCGLSMDGCANRLEFW